MVTLAVLQPGFAPWLGYFDQMIRADVFLHYDTAKFDKNGWRNRNRILTWNGITWLTVPVSAHHGQQIKDVRISNTSDWARKHMATLRQAYAKAPCREECLAALEPILERRWDYLIDLDIALVDVLVESFGIDCQRGFVSDHAVGGDRTEKLVNLCKAVGAETYLTGDAATDYLETDRFAAAGITVEWQRYNHPRYPQCRWRKAGSEQPAFVPYLSVLDLFMNCGKDSGSLLHRAAKSVDCTGRRDPRDQSDRKEDSLE